MIRKFIATVALAGTVVVAASSGAFAVGSTTDPTPKDPAAAAARKQAKCDKAPEVIARIKAAEDKIAGQITKLEVAEAKATAAGKADKATKIADHVTKLKARSAKAAAKLAKVQALVAEKCTAPTG